MKKAKKRIVKITEQDCGKDGSVFYAYQKYGYDLYSVFLALFLSIVVPLILFIERQPMFVVPVFIFSLAVLWFSGMVKKDWNTKKTFNTLEQAKYYAKHGYDSKQIKEVICKIK